MRDGWYGFHDHTNTKATKAKLPTQEASSKWEVRVYSSAHPNENASSSVHHVADSREVGTRRNPAVDRVCVGLEFSPSVVPGKACHLLLFLRCWLQILAASYEATNLVESVLGQCTIACQQSLAIAHNSQLELLPRSFDEEASRPPVVVLEGLRNAVPSRGRVPYLLRRVKLCCPEVRHRRCVFCGCPGSECE